MNFTRAALLIGCILSVTALADETTGARSWFQQHGQTRLHIPEGQLPAPGECRIWYPGRPAGHQPPPARCSVLRAQVPMGAWLLERPDQQRNLEISVYDPSRVGVVLDRGLFDWQGGTLVFMLPLR